MYTMLAEYLLTTKWKPHQDRAVALFRAARHGCEAIVRYLIQKGGVDVNAVSSVSNS